MNARSELKPVQPTVAVPTGKFHPTAALSTTLPGYFYYDPTYWSREKEEIFFRTWQYVGHVGDLQKPGDYISAMLVDQPVAVVRGADHKLRAFYNVCTHRAHPLVKGSGNARRLVCGYHSWAFDLEGRLKTAPNCERVRNFNKEDHSLSEIRVEQFLNAVMVNLDPDAQPLIELVAGLDREIRQFLPEIERFHLSRIDKFSLKCNWKLFFDQLEAYHVQTLHPKAVRTANISLRKTTEYDLYHSASTFMNEQAQAGDSELIFNSNSSDPFAVEKKVWYLWPNYLLLGQPGAANLTICEYKPDGTDHTDIFLHHFHQTTPPLPGNVKQMDILRDVIFPEDLAAIEAQQVGVKARGFRGGRLIVDEAHSNVSEHATHWFQKKIWELHKGTNYET